MSMNLTGEQIKKFIHQVSDKSTSITNELNLIADSLRNALARSTLSNDKALHDTYVTMGDTAISYKESIQTLIETLTENVNSKANELTGVNEKNASEVVRVQDKVEDLGKVAESYKNKYASA